MEKWLDLAQTTSLNKWANSTTLRYESKWKWWISFCEKHRVPSIITQPEQAKLVGIAYSSYLYHSQKKHYGVIVQCRAAVTRVYILNHLPSPFRSGPLGIALMAAIKKARPSPKKKEAITKEELIKVIKWVKLESKWKDADHIILAFLLGWCCLMRVSEYSIPSYNQEREWLEGPRGMGWSNITISTKDCFGDINIKMRKNDQSQRGHKVRIHSTNEFGQNNNPYLLLKSLVRSSKEKLRPTLLMECNMNGGGIRPLRADTVRERLATACEATGIRRDTMSTTSLRSGGVSYLLSHGWSGVEVAVLGGWSSLAYEAYIQRSAVLNKMMNRLNVK